MDYCSLKEMSGIQLTDEYTYWCLYAYTLLEMFVNFKKIFIKVT